MSLSFSATSAQDFVIRNRDGTITRPLPAGPSRVGGAVRSNEPEGGRRKWGGGKGTAVVNVLGKADICSETIVVKKHDETKGLILINIFYYLFMIILYFLLTNVPKLGSVLRIICIIFISVMFCSHGELSQTGMSAL